MWINRRFGRQACRIRYGERSEQLIDVWVRISLSQWKRTRANNNGMFGGQIKAGRRDGNERKPAVNERKRKGKRQRQRLNNPKNTVNAIKSKLKDSEIKVNQKLNEKGGQSRRRQLIHSFIQNRWEAGRVCEAIKCQKDSGGVETIEIQPDLFPLSFPPSLPLLSFFLSLGCSRSSKGLKKRRKKRKMNRVAGLLTTNRSFVSWTWNNRIR